MAAPNFLTGSAFLKLYWSTNAQLAMNVLGVVVTGNPTFDQALANTLGTAVKTAYTTNLATSQAPTASLVRVGIRDYRTANRPEFRDANAAVSGSAAGDALPSQVALCISLRTASTGKSGRGRVYLPGWSEAFNVANGIASAGIATAAVTFIQAIDTALKSNGMALGVLSRPAERQTIVRTTFHNDGTSTVDTLSNVSQKAGQVLPVTLIESRNTNWETQRRRGNQRGAVPSTLFPVASVTL